jgi:hypothetical protein
VNLVGQAGGEELRMNRPATLNHQTLDAARSEVIKHGLEIERSSQSDNVGEVSEAFAQLGNGCVRQ